MLSLYCCSMQGCQKNLEYVKKVVIFNIGSDIKKFTDKKWTELIFHIHF